MYLKNIVAVNKIMEITGDRTGGKPTPWPMGTVHIQQIHGAFLASVCGGNIALLGDLKSIASYLLIAASQGHSAGLLG